MRAPLRGEEEEDDDNDDEDRCVRVVGGRSQSLRWLEDTPPAAEWHLALTARQLRASATLSVDGVSGSAWLLLHFALKQHFFFFFLNYSF